MAEFELPDDLRFNREPVRDPEGYAKDRNCVSWLHLCGDEFAAMEGGISFEQIRAAVPFSANVVSDPPRVLDLDLARRHVAALDALPRPTLISCRAGPRAAAVAYMYSGLEQGADPSAVLAAASENDAPFAANAEYREWVASSITALRAERG